MCVCVCVYVQYNPLFICINSCISCKNKYNLYSKVLFQQYYT